MANPRIFVSSTYYDLKYIRENMKRLIEEFNYTPILNEFGNITYEPNQSLDKSCFNEIDNCDMLILIVGGRYGSSIDEEDNDKKKFYDRYTSITSQEYRTAYQENIPIYIFIEKNVNSEYYTYLNNKGNEEISYAHSDSINIYEFVDELKENFANNIIFKFEKFEDIERILKEQWAGLFQQYLKKLRTDEKENRITDTIDKLEIVTDSINEMVNEMGKQLLDESEEYKKLLEEQNKKLISFYSEKIISNFTFNEIEAQIDQEKAEKILKIIEEEYLSNDFYNNYKKPVDKFSEKEKDEITSKWRDETKKNINNKFKENDINLTLKGINFPKTFLLKNLELDKIIKNNDLYDIYKEKMIDNIINDINNKVQQNDA